MKTKEMVIEFSKEIPLISLSKINGELVKRVST